MRIIHLIDKINVSKHIVDHLVGVNHNHVHRVSVGIIIAYIGTYLTHFMSHYSLFVTLTGELVGFGMHGIGLIPIIHLVEGRKIRKPKTKTI